MFDENLEQQPVETPSESPEVPEIQQLDQPDQQAQPKPETPQQRNFKALKEAKEKVERERDELLRRVQQQEETAKQKVVEEPQLNPDDLVEARYVDKKVKQLEEQVRTYQKQAELVAIDSRLKAQYPDFDAVVSKDNLDILTSAYPELGATLNHSPDLYTKAVTAYTLIKKFDITSQDPYGDDKQLAQRNASKPKPLASIAPQQGDTPLTKANVFASGKLTPELKSQLYKEMMEARNNYTARDNQ